MGPIWGRLLVDSLVKSGVKLFIICPGLRSAPLSIAAGEHPDAEVQVALDERGGAFLALGYGLAQKKPAALILTSGSALGNAFPAVMEASHAQVPLVILSADRPEEMQQTLANQTTAQHNFFSPFVRYHFSLPSPNAQTKKSLLFRVASQAYLSSIHQTPGPVHINCPFREPLFNQESSTQTIAASTILMDEKIGCISPLSPKIKNYLSFKNGIIFAGKTANPLPLKKLSSHLGWPLCADILSSSRKDSFNYYELLLDLTEKNSVDVILYLGNPLLSKRSMEWIGQQECPKILLSEDLKENDPILAPTLRIITNLSGFLAQVIHKTPEQTKEGQLLKDWTFLEKIVTQITTSFFERDIFNELTAFWHICSNIPEHYAIFLGNSSPIRHADFLYFPKQKNRTIFANRGLSGIDGAIATCAGIAQTQPIVAIIGDQTFLHDLNSLALLHHTKHPIHLIVVNNGGGRIFSSLVNINNTTLKEKIFNNPHTWNLANAAQLFQLKHTRACNPKTLIESLSSNQVIEFFPSPTPTSAHKMALKESIRSFIQHALVR